MLLTSLYLFLLLLSFFFILEAVMSITIMHKLSNNRAYIYVFLGSKDSSGTSLQRYLYKKVYPKYLTVLGIFFLLFLTKLIMSYTSVYDIYAFFGFLGVLGFLRFYNRQYFSALWKVFSVLNIRRQAQ